MKRTLLKLLRLAGCLPFLTVAALALYNAWNGADAFTGPASYGLQAFLLTLIAYAAAYPWVALAGIVLIVASTILLKIDAKRNPPGGT